MMPCPHFSWSQFECYNRDPQKYYTQYVLGVREEPTAAMLLGSLFHKAAEKPTYKWQAQLVKLGYTPDYARGITLALKRLEPFPKKREMRVTVPFPKFKHQGRPVSLVMIMDGYNPMVPVEYKTGAAWTQERVDEHEQLTFYAMVHRMAFGRVPKEMILKHANVKNGAVKTFRTVRTVAQVEEFRKRRLEPVMKAIDKEIFHRDV